MKTFPLHIVSQERKLVSVEVESVSIPTSEGEITILADHIPLFTKVKTGELVYRQGSEIVSVVVSNGFMNVSPEGEVKVMVDSGVLDRNISLEKAQTAIKAAQETMEKTQDQRELMMAEASLRQAMMEVKVAQKTKKTKI
ncbi:MAG: ATP synthase F1 subunit epsilon [Candidatus Pacebacteria bacterium RIFOXYB1_FULL_39_46]|nr:MAG: ATP synthase F1 subunit epsilon [Candidatus Pacebacteria bacterium RIFOXYB1_FULL_39_46]OGJ39303.1 MAG: ATP synthase F1 subunit epsilon [Candidatus Pacebacteria bacterium RIFOXYA1_FULL_38_18]OGJ40983.1 MAG: ATP synthase F1 subunit epsilon [Candidatus Pacebacteria bacterium RIFOXYD1_FULL_39_27]OGJ41164.1 MAG: ATP synthase F1 subunit epsilon [Candidatus Pacebacteria bacterium RIFOXYC1_FULL_39_21]